VPLFQKIFNFLFPPACVICQNESSLFCENCQNQIDFLYFTPKLKTLAGYYYELQVLGFYAEPLAQVIKAYKYEGIYQLAPILAKLLYKHLQFPDQLDFISYIPLHPKKQRARGFNQTELIANKLSLILKKPTLNLFIRKFHTQSLASTANQQAREKVTQNVFELVSENLDFLENKQILIIDDVVTSGATFASCLKLLKPLHLKKVYLVTLAHEG
jgi:competence protein ComFC